MGNILVKKDMSQAPDPKGGLHDKGQKYKWARPSSAGEFAMIHKEALNIDGEYQREATSQERIMLIARHFDWRRFGVILVSKRPDGSLWIVDGGHRVRATFYRSDVDCVPCLVFDVSSGTKKEVMIEEARIFLNVNGMVSNVNAFGRHKAGVKAGDDVDLAAKKICEKYGYKVMPSGNFQKGGFLAIGSLKSEIARNPSRAERTFGFLATIADGDHIPGEAIRGLATLLEHIDGVDVLQGAWAERLTAAGIAGIMKSIRVEKYNSGRGGAISEAKGILNILNNRLRERNRLVWK